VILKATDAQLGIFRPRLRVGQLWIRVSFLLPDRNLDFVLPERANRDNVTLDYE